MFVGHLAVALAAKRQEPRLSLGVLVAATMGIDLLWPVFLLAGLETVRVDPGNTAFTPLAFDAYPWSHSLAATTAWAALAGAAAWGFTRRRGPALVIFALVLSHWVLDALTHRPDLPLLPAAGSPLVGFGLWNSVPATIVVEGAMFAAGIVLYARETRALDRTGTVAFVAFLALTGAIWITSPFAPPPPSAAAVAWVGLATWLLPLWAAWFDRKRGPAPSAEGASPLFRYDPRRNRAEGPARRRVAIMPMAKRLGAEFLGTFWLVLGGCGSAVLAAAFPNLGIGFVGVALAFGLTVLTMAFAIGHISGCHLNPAVSVGLAAGGRFSWSDLIPYVVAQVAGAAVAAAVLWVIASGAAGFDLAGGFASNGYGEHSPGGYSLLAGLVCEVVMTFMFLIVILGSTDDRAPKGFAPIAIGLGLTLIHLISIPVTNTSVNPARSTGPALFVGGWALAQLWMFWVAPIVGAALAGVAYRWFGSGEARA